MAVLTKEEFAKTIASLKQDDDMADEIYSTMTKQLDKSVHGDFPIQPHFLFNYGHETIVDLLSVMFDDTEDEWIAYFIYELDYGRNWKPGMIVDADENNIKLETTDDLYDLITSGEKINFK